MSEQHQTCMTSIDLYRKHYAAQVDDRIKSMTADPGTWPCPRYPSPLQTTEPHWPPKFPHEELFSCRLNAWRMVMDQARRLTRPEFKKYLEGQKAMRLLEDYDSDVPPALWVARRTKLLEEAKDA